jgi:hypothetical protein
MPMPPYPVLCYWPGCGRSAVYKIAARWNDGETEELKTYSLCCESCLAELYLRAKRKQAACRLAPGESLAVPGIYQLARGRHDNQLTRRSDLEEELTRPVQPPTSS